MSKYDFREFEKEVFTPRFSMLSKTELELKLFQVFIAHPDNRDLPPYEIGLRLGLTESRVRNLKLKLDLINQAEVWEPQKILLGKTVSLDGGRSVIIQANDTYQLEALWHYLTDKCGIVVNKFGHGSQISFSLDKYFEILGKLSNDDQLLAGRLNGFADSEKEIARYLKKVHKRNLSDVFNDAELRKSFATEILGAFGGPLVSEFMSVVRRLG